MRSGEVDAQAGRCWGCGYLLRGVESAACPECGRAFDRADRGSMNFGRPMGRSARWMVGRLGWVSVGLAAAGAVLTCGTARWPVEGWWFSTFDLNYYGHVGEWRGRLRGLTGVDAAYMAGLVLAAVAVVGWAARVVLRGFAVVRYRPPRFQRGAFVRRSGVVWALAAVSFVGVGVGWPHRLGQRWVANAVEERRMAVVALGGGAAAPTPGWVVATPGGAISGGARPGGLAYPRDRVVLLSAMTQGRTAAARVCALKLFAEGTPREPAVDLERAIRGESDPAVKALEVRLLAMVGRASNDAVLVGLMDDPQAAVREAAADALGIWRRGELHIDLDDARSSITLFLPDPAVVMVGQRTIDVEPPIGVLNLPLSGTPIVRQTSPGTRERLERMMLSGETVGEREAAARALVDWPPAGYRLRYAEWGVFQADAAGNVRLAQAQLEEVPAFVHRVGNLAKELAERITPIFQQTNVWKPVIHLTADRAMAVDLEVCLAGGRPWVVFPRVDDLVMMRANGGSWNGWDGSSIYVPESGLEALDPKGLAALPDLREGLPWMTPRHREYPWDTSFRRAAESASLGGVGGIGVRWQSLIVSPTKLVWMHPPAVGTDPRFAWWERLRQVNCSWVSSRGESDRLLYYDGPTLRPAAVRATPVGDGLKIEATVSTGGAKDLPTRRGVYVRVTTEGVATQWVADVRRPAVAVDVSRAAPRGVDQAVAEFQRAVEAQGLTPGEAAGLVACWRAAFFEAPGRRFLAFMTPGDYDEACPMRVRPTPTERARVGILWTEFPG